MRIHTDGQRSQAFSCKDKDNAFRVKLIMSSAAHFIWHSLIKWFETVKLVDNAYNALLILKSLIFFFFKVPDL